MQPPARAAGGAAQACAEGAAPAGGAGKLAVTSPGLTPHEADTTTPPAAVAVHCADGGRWLPCSTGMRNCLSAVQKWLEAPTSTLRAKPPSISIEPRISDSVIVEQAP